MPVVVDVDVVVVVVELEINSYAVQEPVSQRPCALLKLDFMSLAD